MGQHSILNSGLRPCRAVCVRGLPRCFSSCLFSFFASQGTVAEPVRHSMNDNQLDHLCADDMRPSSECVAESHAGSLTSEGTPARRLQDPKQFVWSLWVCAAVLPLRYPIT